MDRAAATGDTRIREFADLVGAARRLFVLTGAGLSTESGIPDFRGPNGIWTRNPAATRMFDIDAYRADRQVRVASWRFRYDSQIRRARPNAGHVALHAWQQAKDATIATQNIDGLQQRSGPGPVLELHGSFWQWLCLDCGERGDIEAVFDRIDDGEEDPPCLGCGGILRTATVAFGQPLDPSVLAAAVEAAQSSDVAIAVGTSLAVQPAASLCELAVRSGAALVVLNAQPTGYDGIASLVVNRPIGVTLTEVNRLLGLAGL